ncbi:hemerythrin domain-containing protein [Ramlibacter sp. MAHUQ-53]|uniref:hemerythrin domain-containing protein n=1 Tax=unclassified Ramlibacter TaxID=2617605 RepID=UPI003629470C
MPTRSSTAKDACDLLDADHRAVRKLFKEYEELAGSRARGAAQRRLGLARQVCRELVVHAQVEEEIFYPRLRAVIREGALLDEAEVEHQTMRDLIGQLQAMDTADDAFDARVKVLGEYVEHHVKEERSDLFTRARAARKLDLVALREEIAQRKEALLAEREEAEATTA